jgi:hypothetical protein
MQAACTARHGLDRTRIRIYPRCDGHRIRQIPQDAMDCFSTPRSDSVVSKRFKAISDMHVNGTDGLGLRPGFAARSTAPPAPRRLAESVQKVCGSGWVGSGRGGGMAAHALLYCVLTAFIKGEDGSKVSGSTARPRRHSRVRRRGAGRPTPAGPGGTPAPQRTPGRRRRGARGGPPWLRRTRQPARPGE